MSKGLLLLLSAGSTIALGVVAIGGLWIFPQFADLFEEFENSIPFTTKIVLLSYKLWWVFPLVTLLVGVDLLRRETISGQHVAMAGGLFFGGFVLAFLLLSLSVWAMYAPVMEMSK